MKPADLEALANRIDHEELWRRSGMERDQWSQEQRDRCDAAVNLRRYAHDRGVMLEKLKEGAEYMRGYRLERANRGTDQRGCGDIEWHRAINAFSDSGFYPKPEDGRSRDWPRMMYTAKMVADEVPRMILLFESERQGNLGSSYKMCGHDPRPATPLPDNHLRCALGKQCRTCPYLGAIEANERMTNEAKDEAKAWTCATHILLESRSDAHFEQFLRDKSDDAFEARLVQSFATERFEAGQR